MTAVYSYDYDLAYDPAAPQVTVNIRLAGSDDGGVSTNAMVDSGADATMIPENILDEIGSSQTDTGYLLGVTGYRTAVSIHKVAIRMGPFKFPNVLTVASESGSEILIGSDILNHLSVLLNGPAQVVEVSE